MYLEYEKNMFCGGIAAAYAEAIAFPSALAIWWYFPMAALAISFAIPVEMNLFSVSMHSKLNPGAAPSCLAQANTSSFKYFLDGFGQSQEEIEKFKNSQMSNP